MLNIINNKDLAPFNTLAAPSKASHYAKISNVTDIEQALSYSREKNLEIRVLGGGSNLILSQTVDALVLHCDIKGIDVESEADSSVKVKVGGGENWHQFVNWAVEKNYTGIENLALIPGTVGAAPVQNIGAYGVEVKSTLVEVCAVDLSTGESKDFSNSDCQFAYRDSVFKHHENRYFITHAVFELSKQFDPILEYGPLQSLKANKELTARHVFDEVVSVRNQKLPNPDVIPNAGSFFKNPIVYLSVFNALKEKFPQIVGFPSDENAKLAAGWLIDQCGLKGQANSAGVGCFEKQALVLVNPNKAAEPEILSWATTVKQAVLEKFGVELEIEPRRWV